MGLHLISIKYRITYNRNLNIYTIHLYIFASGPFFGVYAYLYASMNNNDMFIY